MKTSSFLSILVILHGSLCSAVTKENSASVCFADNCLRGIRGTRANAKPPLTSRLADCSNFMQATITPAPVTITITTATVTITASPLLHHKLELRQETVVPTDIPSYATYCSGSSAYSSGCSCVGITKTTLTVSTPTITEYATATATYVPPKCNSGLTVCDGQCKNLMNDNSNCGQCGKACQPGFVCGQSACVLPGIYLCKNIGEGCGGSCEGYCFPDVNGVGFCKIPRGCAGLLPCSTGANCPSTVCLVNVCGHVCAGTESLCPNELLLRTIFQKSEADDRLESDE